MHKLMPEDMLTTMLKTCKRKENKEKTNNACFSECGLGRNTAPRYDAGGEPSLHTAVGESSLRVSSMKTGAGSFRSKMGVSENRGP